MVSTWIEASTCIVQHLYTSGCASTATPEAPYHQMLVTTLHHSHKNIKESCGPNPVERSFTGFLHSERRVYPDPSVPFPSFSFNYFVPFPFLYRFHFVLKYFSPFPWYVDIFRTLVRFVPWHWLLAGPVRTFIFSFFFFYHFLFFYIFISYTI